MTRELKITSRDFSTVDPSIPDAYIDETDPIHDLNPFTGLPKPQEINFASVDHTLTDKLKFQSDNNIKPGDQAWVKLHFAKPTVTGENPYQ